MHIYISDLSVISTICEALLARTDHRIVIQPGRNELLTSSIQREMNRPQYSGDSSFLAPLVKQLFRAYDFRNLRNIDRPISYKAVYNEAIIIWNELNEFAAF